MTVRNGFELLKKQKVEELDSVVSLFRHVKSGAELLSVENDDTNKVFSVNFRTPPKDSAGIAHIMEHSVLCGSRKFPLKEPFIELVKGSINTFLNAMTYPDMTIYPVASTNSKDFYNLVDVYLDAVFFPLITPETLEQEGWHYEIEDPEKPLIYKGVVFNEMKGVYSSPDNLMYRYTKKELYPSNTYHHDSGGDPTVIPELTYKQFKDFHEHYYHPSNARIFFYGDDDVEKRFELLDQYLNEFEKQPVHSEIPLQEALTEPKRKTYFYDVSESKKDEKKGMMNISWLLPEANDSVRTMLFQIWSYMIVSTPASPLRKALMDSKLGESLTGGGVSAGLRQMSFSVGMKGVKLEDMDKLESFIYETLEQIAKDGFEQELLEAAINTLEFQLRENNTGSYPRGLSLMLRAMGSWLYDGDPIEPLFHEKMLSEVKKHIAENPGFFESLIGTYLLENKHKVTLLMEPKVGHQKELEEKEKEELRKVKEGLSKEQVAELIAHTKHLKKLQETPDSPEVLDTIPSLGLGDLNRQGENLPIETSETGKVDVLFHDLFTNGIMYFDIGFDLRVVPQDLLAYVPLFSRSLIDLGTTEQDYVKLAQRIRRTTGGVSSSSFTTNVWNQPEAALWMFMRGKATISQCDEVFSIISDVLVKSNLDNQERFLQLVRRSKAGMESSLVPSGHSIAVSRLAAQFDQASWISEQMGGVSYLFFLRKLVAEVENDWPSVLEKLEKIRKLVINANTAICNVTLDQDNWKKLEPQFNSFLGQLPRAEVVIQDYKPTYLANNEGLTLPSQVNYVAKGANLYDLGYQLDGSISMILRYLRTTWLWDKVRVQGGAYGGMCRFNRCSGVFSYLSYRDPNLLDTLDNYDQSANFLRKADISEKELVKSIVGSIGDIDGYQLPDAKGYTSMFRHLIGETDAHRQELREQLLDLTVADIRAFADVLDHVKEKGRVVVVGSKDAIEAANAERDDWLEMIELL